MALRTAALMVAAWFTAASTLRSRLRAPSRAEAASTESNAAEAESDASEAPPVNLFPPGACLGDLCVPDSGALQTLWTNEEDDANYEALDVRPACEANVEEHQRVLLMQLARMFSGSTALEGVLMSSKNFATLCSFRDWQCEGSRIMNKTGSTLMVEAWDISDMLKAYSKYWDLNRPVVFDKSPKQMMDVEYVRDGLVHARLPHTMAARGITELKRAYLMLWRPVCMAHLSRHARRSMQQMGKAAYAKAELEYYKTFVQKHKYLVEKGEHILVVSVGELVWRPQRTQKRIEKFLPCMGELDMNYVPKLHRDIYNGNDWKAHGSVISFGEHVNPEQFYDVKTGQCLGENDLFQRLNPPGQEEAREAVAYLERFSAVG